MKKYFFLAFLLVLLALPGCSKQVDADHKSDTQNDMPENVAAPPEAPQVEPTADELDEPLVSVEAEATPIGTPIYIDGSRANIRAYSINGSSYVCLRDLAYVLNGSRVQFEVGWNDVSVK